MVEHPKPFKQSGAERASQVLGLVHSDICGPMHLSSTGGARYFLTFTDDFTRHSVVYFLRFQTSSRSIRSLLKIRLVNESKRDAQTTVLNILMNIF